MSFEEIGSSTIQSRALGGLSNGTLVFCMPGSKNACQTAWKRILHNQLDVNFKPCNFVELIPRFNERVTFSTANAVGTAVGTETCCAGHARQPSLALVTRHPWRLTVRRNKSSTST